MLYKCLAGAQLLSRKLLLLESILCLFHLTFKMSIFFLFIDFIQIKATKFFLQAVYSRFLFLELPLYFSYLLLGNVYLLQVPVDDLHSVLTSSFLHCLWLKLIDLWSRRHLHLIETPFRIVFIRSSFVNKLGMRHFQICGLILSLLVLLLQHCGLSKRCWIKRKMRHNTHVMKLADDSVLFHMQDLVGHFLFICLGLSKLIRQMLFFILSFLTKLIHQFLAQILIFFRNLLSFDHMIVLEWIFGV